MDYRQGQCASCKAEYKIPASFQHDAAKCKQCGGVVHIGPVTSDAATAKPAPPSQPVPARQFAGKRAEEPRKAPEKPAASAEKSGMLERLKAERAAAAAKGGTLERLKSERAGEPPQAKPAAPKPASPAAKPATKVPVGAGAGAAPGRTSPTSGASARRSSRRRGGDDDGGDDSGRGRRGAARREKKPSMALVGVALVLLLGGGGAAWWMFLRDGETTTQAAETAQEPEAGVDAGADAADEPMDAAGADDEGADAEAGAAGDDGADGDGEAAGDGAAGAETAEPAAAEEPAKEKPKGDPSAVDLAAYPDFGAPKGASAAEWAELEELVTTFLADDGARSMRALRTLEAKGAVAVPAMLNGMKTLDLGTEDGQALGYSLQKALTEIAHGSNFGWYEGYDDTPHYQNKRVVEGWIKIWQQADESISAWIKFAKLEEKDPEEAAQLRETFAAEGAAIEDDDLDLDVD
jgi:hypothetical protein